MSNADVLRKGTEKAKRIIDDEVGNILLPVIAGKLLEAAINGRIFSGHNMTGNTVNSYAVGVYVKGKLTFMRTPSGEGGISKPLRRKLGQRQKFFAGSQRWDGEIQEKTFTAQVGSNGAMEPDQSIAFLQSYQANPKGYVIVVCNGVEYATYQENEMNIDTLTANFDYARMFVPSMIRPVSS